MGADLFEIRMVEPYSTDYNTVLDEAQRDQNAQARPELAAQIENWDSYDVVFVGYPNWWASIPMPIASFLEEYDFSGKRILPFCSHCGGTSGDIRGEIKKLCPKAEVKEALGVCADEERDLKELLCNWLKSAGILTLPSR